MLFEILRRLRGPLFGAACAGLIVAVPAGLAGSGVGGVFNLGEVNSVNAQTTLSGNAGGNPQLRVENSATVQNAFGVLGRITAGSPANQTAGVRGINSGTNGNGFGVWGLHNGSGAGVFGEAAAGTGVRGEGLVGVAGFSSASDPTFAAVRGSSTGGGAGVEGTAPNSPGIRGCSPTCSLVFNGMMVGGDFQAGTPSGGGVGVIGRGGMRGGEFRASDFGGVGVIGFGGAGAGAIGVLGSSAGGFAGRFEGNLHATGRITKDYLTGMSSQAIPIAYGVVRGSDGSLLVGTQNVTSSYDVGSGRYLVSIFGETYASTTHIAVVTPSATTSSPIFATSTGASGKLAVKIWNLSGAGAKSTFSFAVYKP